MLNDFLFGRKKITQQCEHISAVARKDWLVRAAGFVVYKPPKDGEEIRQTQNNL